MNCNTLSLKDRAQKAAEVLKIDKSYIEKVLVKELGIEFGDAFSESLMDANSTTDEMVLHAIYSACSDARLEVEEVKMVRVMAAAAILKGRDPFKTDKEIQKPAEALELSAGSNDFTTVVKYIKDSRPIQQYKDRELLEYYAAERDYEAEQELHRRAHFMHFVILQKGKHEPGKEIIDIDASLDLLKASRRRTNPAMIPMGDTVVPVYRITELNPEGRLVELCPICGDILYKGYCGKCELNFQGIGDDARAYARLVVDSGKFKKDSHSDRLALWRSASKGVEDLRNTWPSLQKIYDERKLTGDLPKLRVMENRPSSQVADPFHVSGNRSY